MSAPDPDYDIELFVCTVCDTEFGECLNYQRHLNSGWHRDRVLRAAVGQAQLHRCLSECTLLVRQLSVSDAPIDAAVAGAAAAVVVDSAPTSIVGEGLRRQALACPAPHCRARLAGAAQLNAHWTMCVVAEGGGRNVSDISDASAQQGTSSGGGGDGGSSEGLAVDDDDGAGQSDDGVDVGSKAAIENEGQVRCGGCGLEDTRF